MEDEKGYYTGCRLTRLIVANKDKSKEKGG